MPSLEFSRTKSKRKRNGKKSEIWKSPIFWLLVLLLLGGIVGIILAVTSRTSSGGPSPHPTPPPPSNKGAADMKVCGVFDGFSHWDLNAMMQFLAYFKQQTGAPHVVIYEAQFIPKSWFKAVGINLDDSNVAKKYNLDPGSKRAAPWLPIKCTANTDCQQGENCNPEGVCVNPCVSSKWSKNVSCAGDQDCNKLYTSHNCLCPPNDPKTGKATCGYCRTDNKTCHYNMPSDTVESYQDSEKTKWGRFNDNDAPCDTPDGAKKCTSFMMTQMQAGATWEPKDDGGYVKSMDKAGVSAICPYGQYYDPKATTTPFGDCVDWTQKCGNGETSVMGFCDKTTTDTPLYSPKPKIEVWDGKNTVPLPMPEITLTWYAFSGDVKTATTDTTAKGYTQLILDFCMKAGIKNLAFPFIVPDKNNRPWIINGGNGGPIPTDTKTQIQNAVEWIVTNVLTPAQKNGITIGLNVYADGKNSQWNQWYKGGGPPSCPTGVPNYLGCAWEYIGKFINDIDTTAGNIPGIDFIQVDQEWGNFGDLDNAIKNLQKFSKNPNIKFTMAGSLKNPGNVDDSGSIMVPEVYWDAGNQYPCTGGPYTYLYTNRACTTSTTHRMQRNRPKGFYNSIVGDETHYGSDYWDEKKQPNLPSAKNGPWLNANNFATMQKNLKSGKAYVYPSFSIENLSMCSLPNKMTLITKEGRQRWVCVGPDGKTELPPDETDCASLLYYGSSGSSGGDGGQKTCKYDPACKTKDPKCKSTGMKNSCTCTDDWCRDSGVCHLTKSDGSCPK